MPRQRLFTNIPLDRGEGLLATKLEDILRRTLTELRREVPYILDFPGNPLGPAGAMLGVLGKATKVRGAFTPLFQTTEDALEFGLGARGRPTLIKMLKELAGESAERIKGIKDLELKMEEATRGQFFREAVEAAEGKVDPMYLRGIKPLRME